MISVFSVYAAGEYQTYFTSHFQSCEAAQAKARQHAAGLRRWKRVAATDEIVIEETRIEQQEI